MQEYVFKHAFAGQRNKCPSVSRLHMLSELEEYFRVCHDFPMRSEDSSESSGHCSLEGLLKQWDARLQMAQVIELKY